jgi:predicted RNase H-like nuclease (RuvC/YqgF family)
MIHLSELDTDLTQNVHQIVEIIGNEFKDCEKIAKKYKKQSRESLDKITSETNYHLDNINKKIVYLNNRITGLENKIQEQNQTKEELSKKLKSQRATNEFYSKLISGAKDEIDKLYK